MNRIPEPEHMDDPAEAESYACADFAEINELFVERLLEMKPEPGPVRCLDAGTGPADIPRRLLAHRPEWRVTGVDASWCMLDCARRGVGLRPDPDAAECVCDEAAAGEEGGQAGQLSLIRGNICRLPFPSGSFDVVISNGVLHHLPSPVAFWAEARRVARPGAVLLVRDLARPDTPEEARQLVETYAASKSPLLQDAFYRSLRAAYTLDEVHQQLVAAHLSHITINLMTDRHLDVYGNF